MSPGLISTVTAVRPHLHSSMNTHAGASGVPLSALIYNISNGLFARKLCLLYFICNYTYAKLTATPAHLQREGGNL
jgi:hypothetical protein